MDFGELDTRFGRQVRFGHLKFRREAQTVTRQIDGEFSFAAGYPGTVDLIHFVLRLERWQESSCYTETLKNYVELHNDRLQQARNWLGLFEVDRWCGLIMMRTSWCSVNFLLLLSTG